jgi:hypothetical protein
VTNPLSGEPGFWLAGLVEALKNCVYQLVERAEVKGLRLPQNDRLSPIHATVSATHAWAFGRSNRRLPRSRAPDLRSGAYFGRISSMKEGQGARCALPFFR